MPIYEYQCSKCEKMTEVMQKISDPPLATCPSCGGPVSKVVSRTSFQLKGTGWYATDYKKSSSSSKDSKTEATKPASGDTKSASPTETPATDKGKGKDGGKSSEVA